MPHFFIHNKLLFYDSDHINQSVMTIQSCLRSYTISYAPQKNPFVHIESLIRQNPNNIILIDQKLLALYSDAFHHLSEKILTIEASENNKTLRGVVRVLDFLRRNAVTKNEKIIVVGGGITQEISGCAAAMYKRGIEWIYFPTTLLSMCDSCVGGKTSLNYANAKNQLGLFSVPSAIYIYPNFLNTLSLSDIQSGLAEVLKHCILAGEDFLSLYKKNVVDGKIPHTEKYRSLIMMSLSVKKSVVEADEFEWDVRRALNYGHTFGHAIEALTRYKISHGKAIVIGMMMANIMSCGKKLLNIVDKDRLNHLCRDLLTQQDLLLFNSAMKKNILSLMKQDKKNLTESITFVFMEKPGHTSLVSLPVNNVLLLEIEMARHSVIIAGKCGMRKWFLELDRAIKEKEISQYVAGE